MNFGMCQAFTYCLSGVYLPFSWNLPKHGNTLRFDKSLSSYILIFDLKAQQMKSPKVLLAGVMLPPLPTLHMDNWECLGLLEQHHIFSELFILTQMRLETGPRAENLHSSITSSHNTYQTQRQWQKRQQEGTAIHQNTGTSRSESAIEGGTG